MKRNTLLIVMIIFGAGAVGGLVFLSSGANGAAPRSGGATSDRSAGAGGGRTGNSSGVVLQEVPPGHTRVSGSERIVGSVPPGTRQPYDSPEMIEARQRYAGRIEELLGLMIDGSLRPDQRMAHKRELQQLLRLMGHRVAPSVRERLLQMLGTVEPKWRNQVADAIGSLEGDVETAQALVEMLKSTPDDITTHHAIYSALGAMNVREVTPALMAMLGESYPDEALIIRTIGQLATPKELEALFTRLDQPLRPASRSEIEQVLQDRGRIPGFFDKVAAQLDDADVAKRRSLLRILAASTEPQHAEKVRELLKTETDSESRSLAIRALGKFGDPDSGKVLMEVLQTGPPQDRNRAIQAIFSIRQPETVAILAEDWKGLEAEGRTAVMGAISRLPAPVEQLVELARDQGLRDPELRVRTQAARVLGQRGRDDNVEALAAFLARATHPAEMSAALNALETIRTSEAAAAAIRGLGAVPNDRQRDRWRQRFQRIYEESR